MNHIIHTRITIDYDMWEPFTKEVLKEEDVILFGVKDKTLLAHAGNAKIIIRRIDNG
jgi:hypothetical protein